ncbi:hypothetical protein HOC35_02360 [Candidatus Woesearchaeota archaeon]|jgi:large subunit ribosomal protein L15|nr:hypothetical protein [Candidatus Woesearchaeota archaeon]
MLRKRKKNTRFRAKTTHGYGSMKKNRGKGHKGGSGMAGTGKRADTKKPSVWGKKYFGNGGFVAHNSRPVVAVNISHIEDKYLNLVEKSIITEENNVSVVDFSKLGVDKLLGTGNPTRKYKILVNIASKKAIEKIEKAGGEVVIKVVEKKQEPQEKQEKQKKQKKQVKQEKQGKEEQKKENTQEPQKNKGEQKSPKEPETKE